LSASIEAGLGEVGAAFFASAPARLPVFGARFSEFMASAMLAVRVGRRTAEACRPLHNQNATAYPKLARELIHRLRALENEKVESLDIDENDVQSPDDVPLSDRSS
jgi:hypothetical protein